MKTNIKNPLSSLKLLFMSCLCALMLSAVFWVTLSTTPNSQVYADSCIPPTNYPSQPVGGMAYTNWHFDTSQSISSVQFKINIFNNPGNTSDEYLQLYDANIDNTGQYFGLQTTGLAIFSQWNTSDMSNIELGPGSYDTNGTEVGAQYISLRHSFGNLPVGQYSVRMVRTNYDGTGDWFAYYVTFPGQAEQYIGSIRFPRASAGTPASFRDGGGTWVEFWDNNGNTLYPVPLWHVNVDITGNSGLVPDTAISSYSTMPDSDVYAESPGAYVDFVVGASTARCHPAGYLWENVNQIPTPQTPSSTPTPTPTHTSTTTPAPSTSTTPTPTPTTTSTTQTSPSQTLTLTPEITFNIKITNANGSPAAGVKVTIDGDSSVTNKKGIAVFAGLSPGNFTATIKPPSSKAETAKIELSSSQPTQNLSFRLAASHTTLSQILKFGGISLLIVVVILAMIVWSKFRKKFEKQIAANEHLADNPENTPAESIVKDDRYPWSTHAVHPPGTVLEPNQTASPPIVESEPTAQTTSNTSPLPVSPEEPGQDQTKIHQE